MRSFPLILFAWMFSISPVDNFSLLPICLPCHGVRQSSGGSPPLAPQLLYTNPGGKERGLRQKEGQKFNSQMAVQMEKTEWERVVAAIPRLLFPSTWNLTLKMYPHLFLLINLSIFLLFLFSSCLFLSTLPSRNKTGIYAEVWSQTLKIRTTVTLDGWRLPCLVLTLSSDTCP